MWFSGVAAFLPEMGINLVVRVHYTLGSRKCWMRKRGVVVRRNLKLI